ncbi:AMP-binding protein [Halorhodospira halochloris]|uniref:AMP-binding protein n=1 Tax=Halorhodospira halochloris TaxID=1052 RepID=UPI001EE91E5B|nr:AMP-binding protein [Halorhodospira halochloris]
MAQINTLQDLVRRLEQEGERDAVRMLTRESLVTWNYADLAQAARELGAGLAANGVEKGDPVGLLAPNTAEWIVACLGIIEAGAIVTPYDTQMPSAELAHAISDSGVSYVFTAGEPAQRLAQLDLQNPPRAIRLDAEPEERNSWHAWRRANKPAPAQVHADDLATLFYTSGTTGAPKGVLLTHGNIAANIMALISQQIAFRNDRVFVPLPYHHVYPFSIGLLTPLTLGATIVLPYSVLGPQIVRALKEGDASIILGVPRLYEALNSAIQTRVAERGARAQKIFAAMQSTSRYARERFGWRIGKYLFRGLQKRMAPSVRMVVSGGAPLDPELGESLRSLGWEVATGYGLTETSPILAYNPPERAKLDSAGLPLPGVELRIGEFEGQDEQAEDSRPGLGEVQARGPNVFIGYHNLPDKTDKAFTKDGFYRTGDLGWFDDEGYLHLEGRASEMIVLGGGENIDPERVEKVLCSAQAIRDAGVLEQNGRLVAVLFADPEALRGMDSGTARQQVNEALQERKEQLPSHHQISDYRISPDPLPRTRLGKMRRHKLRELYEQIASGEVKQEQQPVAIESMAVEDQQLLQITPARRVWDVLAKRFSAVRLTPDTDLRLDLGIDSLGWVDMTLELREQGGVIIGEEVISRVQTVRDLLREAADAAEAGSDEDDAALPLAEQLANPDEVLSAEHMRWLSSRTLSERLVGRAILGIDRLFFRWYCPLEVERVDQVPLFEPVVLAPNHRSIMDSPALGSTLPYARLERIYWGGFTGILFKNAGVRYFSRSTQVLPVDPRAGARTSLALGAAALQRGYGLVWFPEGRRAPSNEVLQFQPGVGLLLQAHPVPVVPVWIEGTEQAMPIGRRWPRPGKLRIRFGAPVMPHTLEEEGEGDTREQRVANALRERVLELGEESSSGD